MSRYNKDIYENKIHGKENLKVGTSGSNGFEVGGSGNAISASYFFGDGSGLTGISGGGGGGTTYSQWIADAPPDTPNSLDDEFTGPLTGWSTFDPGSSGFAATTVNNRLVLSQSTFVGDKNAGIYINAPTASSGDYEYAFWTKASWISEDLTDFPICYLWIAEDVVGNPLNTDLWTIGVIREANAFRTHAQYWTSYSSYNSTYVEYTYSQSSYLRIRVGYAAGTNTTTFSFDKSNNGEGWYKLVTRTYTGHLKHIGLGLNNVGGPAPFYGLFDFFRVYDSADFFYFPSGSNVQLTKA